MKTTILWALLCLFGLGAQAQSLPSYSETFETNGEGSRYTSNTFNTSAIEYFERRTITSGLYTGTTVALSGQQGSFTWTAEGVRGTGAATPRLAGVITLNPIATQNYKNIVITVALAAPRGGTYSGAGADQVRTTDQIRIEYSFDGSPFTTGAQFVGNNSSGSGDFQQDTDLDGAANAGAAILDQQFRDVVVALPTAATGAALRVRVVLDSKNPEVAFDNIRVTGVLDNAARPTLTGLETNPISFTEGNGPVQITNTLQVGYSDATNTLTGATLQITNYVAGQDALNFTNQNGISGSFSNGTLTLAGTATLAAYQAALRSVTYSNSNSTTASGVTRIVSFLVFNGSALSNNPSRSINVTLRLNDPAPLPYTEDFESDGENTRYFASSFYSASNLAGFFRATAPTPPGTASTFSGYNGSAYWFGEGATVPANPTAPVSTIQLAPVNASGYSDLRFVLRLGRGAASTGWFIDDYFRLYYRANGGSWVLFGAFYGNAASEVRRDEDLDGTADANGTLLSSTLQDITFANIPNAAAVASLDFKLEQSTEVTEEIAFDFIRVTGVTLPTVTTAAPSTITATSAVLGGNVTNGGGGTVTERGVVYVAGTGTPTTGNTKDTNGSGVGSFSETITGLAAATTYSVRAYAINSAGTAYGATQTFTTATTVTSIVRANASPTNASTVNYTVTFANAVAGLSSANFSVTSLGGLSGASVSSVTGSGTTYTVAVNTGSGTGTLRLDLVNDTGITPGAANLPFTGPVYTLDRTAPTVTSVGVPVNGTYKAGDVLNFTVSFSKAIIVAGAPSLSLTVGTSPVQAGYVAGSGSSILTFRYTVIGGQVDADGLTIGLLVLNSGSLQDVVGNNAILTLNNVASTAGILIDAVAPTVGISSSAGASGGSTSTSPIPLTVTFSEPVTNFVLTDVTVTNGTLAGFAGGPTTYTFVLTPASSGTVTVNIGAGVAQDAGGNGNTAAPQFSINYQPITATPVVTTPPNGSTTATNTPSYGGVAPAGSTVAVYVDASLAGSTTADGTGSWTLTPPTALTPGSHTVYATAQLPGAAVSPNSNLNTFVVPSPAVYSSSTAEQPVTSRVAAGSTNQEILRVTITTSGTSQPLSAQSFSFTTAGSSAVADIDAARVFYTGSSSTFATATLFGSAVANPGNAFSITGTQQLNTGPNYFWLVYDVAANAPTGNVLDATVSGLTVGGTLYTPTVTAPAGNRRIVKTARTAGTALQFAGVGTAGYVNFSPDATNPAPTLGPQYTQAVWIKRRAGSGNTPYYVLGNGTGDSAAPYLYITGNGRLGAGFGTAAGRQAAEYNSNAIALNEWNHVAATYTGTLLTVYLNGVSVATLTPPAGVARTPANTPVSFVGSAGTTGANYFPGDIDEVSQWNRALSQSEIRLMRHLVLRGTEPGLLSYLQFNDSGATTTDVISGTTGSLTAATRVGSTAPVSFGVSNLQAVTGPANYVFSGTNAAINFTSVGGTPHDVVVSRLEGTPLGTPPAATGLQRTFNKAYWIVNRYSAATFSASITYTLTPPDISPADATTPANLKLFKRESNSDEAFEAPISAASASAVAGTVTFPVTSFSQTVIGTFGTSPLPVELTAFTAALDGPLAVRLAWTTASEKNSAYFEAERSLDAITFTRVGTVAAAGSSNSPRTYRLPDRQLPAGATVLYYRLRQVDTDGSTALSPVQVVQLRATTAELRVHPNPTSEAVAQLTGAEPEAVVQVFDALGRLVFTTRTDTAGHAQLRLAQEQPVGLYLVRTGGRTLRLVRE